MTDLDALPWWDVLPADYHRQPQSTPMHLQHPLKVAGSAALDHVLRTGLATAVLGAMAPNLLPGRIRRELEQVGIYRDLASLGDPAQVFAVPPRGIRIDAVPESIPGLAKLGARVHRLSFDSPYVALNPAVREAYAGRSQNLRATAQHWTHADGPRRTLIFVHGYSLDAYWVNSQMFSLRWFFRQGWDILLYTLPFHGSRRAPRDPFSGFGYFSRGFSQTNEAMLQAIFELRLLMDHLQDTGVPGIGISGLSLGGYITSLLAAVDDRLAFAIPNAAVVSPADMVMEWAPLRQVFALGLPRLGMEMPALRHLMAVHSPLTYAPRLAPERLLIIAGAGDRFTAPRYQTLLHRHWAGSTIHWFPGNHVVHLHQREYLRLMRDFMNTCCPAGGR